MASLKDWKIDKSSSPKKVKFNFSTDENPWNDLRIVCNYNQVKTFIYAVGVQTGGDPHETSLAETFMYKSASDTWVEGFKLPSDRIRASCCTNVYRDKLYMACEIIDGHWDGHVQWFDCYDFKTGKCSTLPSLNIERHGTQLIW